MILSRGITIFFRQFSPKCFSEKDRSKIFQLFKQGLAPLSDNLKKRLTDLRLYQQVEKLMGVSVADRFYSVEDLTSAQTSGSATAPSVFIDQLVDRLAKEYADVIPEISTEAIANFQKAGLEKFKEELMGYLRFIKAHMQMEGRVNSHMTRTEITQKVTGWVEGIQVASKELLTGSAASVMPAKNEQNLSITTPHSVIVDSLKKANEPQNSVPVSPSIPFTTKNLLIEGSKVSLPCRGAKRSFTI